MKDKELEDYGAEILGGMGFHVDHRLDNAYCRELDPEGSYDEADQMEVDYLIPLGDLTLVGEITGEVNQRDSKDHVKRFAKSLNVLKRGTKDVSFWRALGVPSENIHHYLNTRTILGFFITNKHNKYSVNLPNIDDIVCFYESDWEQIVDYSRILGKYSKRHFLEKLGSEQKAGTEKIIVVSKNNFLASYRYRHIASNIDSFAHLYRFEISPYDILPITRVARRDSLPSLSEEDEENYQRPLNDDKINEIRNILRNRKNFIFPNNILCVLSNECRYYDDGNRLTIPQKYGSLTVIDGQHRLYSYADEDIEDMLKNPLISITAIAFDGASKKEINSYSAYTFLEINATQTRIEPEFLDVIAFDILGKTDKKSLAAKVINDINEREEECTYGMFDTYRSGSGLMQIQTIKTYLSTITNTSTIESLTNAQSGDRGAHRHGYEFILDANIDELTDPQLLVEKTEIAVRRFFSTLRGRLYHDWPDTQKSKSDQPTVLALAKAIAGLIILLRDRYIEHGRDWDHVQNDFDSLKQNLLSLREVDPDTYEDGEVVLLDKNVDSIPGADVSPHDFARFFNANISSPTEIAKVPS